ncbi:MAG: sulfur carrier protein ThiS [Clostridiales bacterium]|jgi:thiamine biosynthesis protein ThiS|nr:sulfur carrier protein ThiS [Clostridiales bacterium]
MLKVNGEQRKFKDGQNIADLIKECGYDKDFIVVEVNLEIIPKGKYRERPLNDGDEVEILRFMGGG